MAAQDVTGHRPPTANNIRVVVADDSEICRAALQQILEDDGDIEVVGQAADGKAAIDAVRRLKPQLVTLDVEMPKMDGLAAVEQIMAQCPVPILIVTARSAEQRTSTHFEAVRRGALDVVAKPTLGRAACAEQLRALVRRLSRVPVMRHLAGGRSKPRIRQAEPVPRGLRIVGIGASAGGPGSVIAILSKLPKDFSACVVVVQHMLADFANSYVRFLQGDSALPVELLGGPTQVRPGTVFVAPGDRHVVASSAMMLVSTAGPPIHGCRPSVDALFESLARHLGGSAAGVVLSGIGRDGAAGLLAMRKAGALTIAQDEESSIVYGMPRAASENGAAMRALSPAEIADDLTRAAAGAGGQR